MLGFYLSTVVIWMIIIWCLMMVFKDRLKKKLVKKEEKKSVVKTLGALFILSAIPIFRLLIAIAIVYMATCSQEEFDEFMNKNKQEENHDESL